MQTPRRWKVKCPPARNCAARKLRHREAKGLALSHTASEGMGVSSGFERQREEGRRPGGLHPAPLPTKGRAHPLARGHQRAPASFGHPPPPQECRWRRAGSWRPARSSCSRGSDAASLPLLGTPASQRGAVEGGEALQRCVASVLAAASAPLKLPGKGRAALGGKALTQVSTLQ